MKDFKTLLPALKRSGVDLASAGGVGEPVIEPHLIEFNGTGYAACEPFRLERAIGGRHWRTVGAMPRFFGSDVAKRETSPLGIAGKCHLYTKTEHQPYDLAVMACLIIAKHHLGKGIVACSDGSEEKWEPAKRLCEEHLGYGGGFRLDKV